MGTLAAATIVSALTLGALPARHREVRPHERRAAEQHAREAERLMSRGRVGEACTEIKTSLELAAETRTLIALADCHERSTFGAAAWEEFGAAAAWAAADHDEEAERYARARQDALERRLPRIVVTFASPGDARDVSVRVDGRKFEPADVERARPVDPRLIASEVHDVVVEAHGERLWATTVKVSDGETGTVRVPSLARDRVADVRVSSRRPISMKQTRAEAGDMGASLTSANSVLSYENPDAPGRGSLLATVLTATKTVAPSVSVWMTQGLARNDPGASGERGVALSNPSAGVKYAADIGDSEFAVESSFEASAPVGSGGGKDGSQAARAAADNAQWFSLNFTPNYARLIPGVALAYRKHRTTVTIAELGIIGVRARGSQFDEVPLMVDTLTQVSVTYKLLRDVLNAYTYSFGFLMLSEPDPAYRLLLFGAGGISVPLNHVVLSAEYGRKLNPPFSRTNDHFATFIAEVSF